MLFPLICDAGFGGMELDNGKSLDSSEFLALSRNVPTNSYSMTYKNFLSYVVN
jgi:hypothetical protein